MGGVLQGSRRCQIATANFTFPGLTHSEIEPWRAGFYRPASAHHSRSPSARLTKIRTARITMVKRKAASCPFQVRDCHIAQYSPATTRKPKNQTPKPTVRPATAQ